MRLLVLGTGMMAGTHVEAFQRIPGVTVAACVDVDTGRAAAFADKHGIAQTFPSLEAALQKGGFDAMTNVTPDAAHYQTTMAALGAGLHVFCEKPLATNHAHAAEMAQKATASGRVNGVNLTYRNVAALQASRALIADGALGDIRHFDAAYLQSWLAQPAWGDWKTEEKWLWRLSEAHGSLGVLGDIGIHIFDFLTFATGSDISHTRPILTTFPKAPGDRIGDYVLDANDSMVLSARLMSGATGVIHATRFAPGHHNDLILEVYGLNGGLRLTNNGDLGTLSVCIGQDMETATWREQPLRPVTTNYAKFADAVMSGGQMRPDFSAAAKLQKVLDEVYAQSKAEAATPLA